MDELVHHCLRELAFDGDLGSDVSRLKDFINAFYAHANASHMQNLDGAFYSFVWSVVVQQPTVLVGLVPERIASEVWVAPQVSAKRKAKARGEDHVETTPHRLDPIPDSKTTSLDALRQAYGDRLRIAAEPEAIFAAITGSHIRSSKMSPMVYSTLQIITRGRDDGVTVIELGKRSGYDQKTCFYLVRQLTGMDLILKVRRGGVGTHFCIHKYFFERSSSWKAIRDEETQAETFKLNSPGGEDDLDDDESNVDDLQTLNFTPIDARHLSSFPLISGRVIRLLKASRNHIHASNNMLITLGFCNPTKTDRRFFQSRIREMIQQGLIERIAVTNGISKTSDSSVKCFRLLEQDAGMARQNDVVPSDKDEDFDDNPSVCQNGVKLNTTFHKQIIDLLEESGTRGMTLNELSSSLGQFDKRTIELLLARADRCRPPPHLSDWHIAGLMETNGRERRHRYYTVANYRELVAREELDKSSAGYEDVDLSNSGNFYAVDEGLFYQTQKDLSRYSDAFKGASTHQTGKAKKRVFKNPILPNGQVKRGRPRKSDTLKSLVDDLKQPSRKRKREPSLPPSKERAEIMLSPEEPNEPEIAVLSVQDALNQPPEKRHRGRTPKVKTTSANEPASLNVQIASVPQKPGRQRLRKEATTGPPHEVASLPIIERRQTRSRSLAEVNTMSTPATIDVDADIPNPSHIDKPDKRKEMPNGSEEAFLPDTNELHLTSVQPCLRPVGPEADAPVPSTDHDSVHVKPRPKTSISSTISTPLPPSLSNSGRVNVSHLRRENEILRVIANAGGIINTQSSKLYDDHMKLLESLAQSGEPTSAPVRTKTDKRTMSSTLDSLERKGRIKQLRTSLTPHNSIASRAACIAYLPDTVQSKLTTFLSDLARPASQPVPAVKKLEVRTEYGASPSTTPRVVPALQRLQMEQPAADKNERWSKKITRADQLFSNSDQEIRDILLAEHTTAAQFYGFIVGKAMRCRHLHLSILRFLELQEVPPVVVSKENRIIDISCLCTDLPLELYCSLVSPLAYNKDLSLLMSSEAGRATLVTDLPQDLQTALQVGRSRPRSRFLDMLEILRSLNLATPLQASTSDAPFITCSPRNNHPTKFDHAQLDGWTINTPMNAPIYWRFHESADIHRWSVLETQPPFWKSVSTQTHGDGIAYWHDLREACINSDTDIEVPDGSQVPLPATSIGIGRSLRRSASWKADYFLTWHQIQFLKRHVDSSGSTPLQISDEREREVELRRISWVVSAPQGIVEDFFSSATEKIFRSVERSKHKALKDQKRKEGNANKSLAKKAEEARLRREQEWTELLQEVYPEGLPLSAPIRIDRVRNNFLQAGSVKDNAKWEKEIQSAIREADIVSTPGLKVPTKSFPSKQSPNSHASSSTAIHSEMSIYDLIDLQGPPIDHGSPKAKRKRKKDGAEVDKHKKRTRRHRFQWNPNFDELARDASVIIRARCRPLPRVDWAAFEQVFPAVPRNTVRQRLVHIKETPGNEAYLRRLEDTWYNLWIKHKGTPLLPDSDDQSPSNFDLIKHIEFLRSHIDKNALRVGFVRATTADTVLIPSDIQGLLQHFEVKRKEKGAPEWEFMWNALFEEGRERSLKVHVFSRCQEDFLCPASESEGTAIAEAALKMVMGTPPELYESEIASTLLRSRGNDIVSIATKNLLSRGVLSKLQRDPTKPRPGRQLKISESNQNAIGGSISRDTFQDAVSLLEELDPNDSTWHEWPLTATDGDCATLIQLVSEGKIDFEIDTSLARGARPALDWNSKKADDDQIETTIKVRYDFSTDFRDSALDGALPVVSDLAGGPSESSDAFVPDGGHGLNASGLSACCRQNAEERSALVDCAPCLHEAWGSFVMSLDRKTQKDAEWIMEIVRQAGEVGIRKAELAMLCTPGETAILPLVNRLIEADLPQAFWVGYDSLVLIPASAISKWSVVVSDNPLTRIFPRRWLDVNGHRVADYWQAAMRAVIGAVIFRPGITQAQLRWRLRSVYDRQEIIEVLRYLHDEGFLQTRIEGSSTGISDNSVPFDEDEESRVYLLIGDRRWYQV